MSLAVQATAEACPGAGDIMSMVVEVSPPCFESCSELCKPLETLINEYMLDNDEDAILSKVCADQGSFSCLFEASNAEECGKLTTAAQGYGMEIPTSMSAMGERCGGAGGEYKDKDTP